MKNNTWVRSSKCATYNSCVEVKVIEWSKSSKCAAGHSCVEVAIDTDVILVRDSKNPQQQPLMYTRDEWEAFIAGVNAGEFNI